MIKRCEVCGKFFEALREFEVICDDPKCKKARNKQKHDEWAARNSDRVREIRHRSYKKAKARKRAIEERKSRIERFKDEISQEQERAKTPKTYGEIQAEKLIREQREENPIKIDK